MTRHRGVALLNAISLWVAWVLIFSCIAFIVFAALVTDPVFSPVGFILLSLLPVVILIQYYWVQSYFSDRFAPGKREGQHFSKWHRFISTADICLLALEAIISAVPIGLSVSRSLDFQSTGLIVVYVIQAASALTLCILRGRITSLTKGAYRFAPVARIPRATDDRELRARLNGLRGEPGWLVFIRVVLTVAFLCGLLAYGVYAVIIQPPSGSSIVVAPYTGGWINDLFLLGFLGWTILITYPPMQPSSVNLAAITTVNAVGVLGFDCGAPYSVNQAVVFPCYNDDPYNSDILITLNFTTLPSSSIVYVYPGLADSPDAIESTTMPIPLESGTHLRAYATPNVRQVYTNSQFAVLGGFLATSSQYLFPKVFSLQPETSSAVPLSPDTATLRLRLVPPHNNVTLIYTDDQRNSVLGGLASAGGLYTLLNGVFALLLGGSLVYNLFGLPPFSIFGVLHLFQKDKLRPINDLPDPSTPLAAFVNRHLIDFGPNNPQSEIRPIEGGTSEPSLHGVSQGIEMDSSTSLMDNRRLRTEP